MQFLTTPSDPVTAIVTCKGRLDHVVRCWPSWREQTGVRFRFVLVDYGCPDGAFDWAQSVGDPRLYAIRVDEGAEFFNLSRARNFGAVATPDPIVVFVDADVVLQNYFLDAATYAIRENAAAVTYPNWTRAGRGICAVHAEAFRAVRGYDEAFEGWGAEDVDFVGRVENIARSQKFGAQAFRILEHDDSARTEFYRIKDKEESNRKNQQRMALSRIVNFDGYATGRARLYIPGQGIVELGA